MSAHEHEDLALCRHLRGNEFDLTGGWYKTAADRIDALHRALDAGRSIIEAKDQTIYRLRSELENQRLALQSIGHEVAVANRRIEQTIYQTPGVMHADTWPEKGQGANDR